MTKSKNAPKRVTWLVARAVAAVHHVEDAGAGSMTSPAKMKRRGWLLSELAKPKKRAAATLMTKPTKVNMLGEMRVRARPSTIL